MDSSKAKKSTSTCVQPTQSETEDMAPKYTLTYFDITGVGEPIRWMLSYGGFDFDDVRIDWTKWPQMKQDKPFGMLPTLEYDGKISHQGLAICRYLARKCDLLGKNDWDNMEIDATLDAVVDLRKRITDGYYYILDEKLKEEKRQIEVLQVMPFYMDRFEKQAKKNDGFIAVPYFTWADIVFTTYMDYFSYMVGFDATANYPTLKSIVMQVEAIPNIQSWLEIRPKNKLNPAYFAPTNNYGEDNTAINGSEPKLKELKL